MAISAFTRTGYLVDDAVRLANIEGDGLAYPDSSWRITKGYTNYVYNGGAEIGTGGWVAANGATLNRITTDHKFGTACFEIVTPGTVVNEQITQTSAQAIAVTAGQTYTVGFWAWAPTGAPQIRMFINQFDAGNVSLGTVVLVNNVVIGQTPVRLSGTFTPVANTVSVRISIGTGNVIQATTYRVDGVGCVDGPVDTPYAETSAGAVAKVAGRAYAPPWVLDPTRGGVAFRLRMGWASTSPPNGATPAFLKVIEGRVDSNNLIGLDFDESTLRWRARRLSASAGAIATTAVDAFARDAVRTVFAAWDGTTVKVRLGAAAFVTVGNTNIPGLPPQWDVGQFAAGANTYVQSPLLWGVFWKGPVSDADAAIINALPDSGIDGTMMPSSIGISGFTDFTNDIINYYPMEPRGQLFDRWGLAVYA